MATDSMLAVLAGNVRRELDARGWSQAELAKRCGWAPPRVNEVLTGRFDPRLGTIEKLAAAFSVPPSSLITPAVPVPIKTREEISENFQTHG